MHTHTHTHTHSGAAKPNIIFVLTDDQDVRLNSFVAMPKTRALIQDQGANISNFFIREHTCPWRVACGLCTCACVAQMAEVQAGNMPLSHRDTQHLHLAPLPRLAAGCGVVRGVWRGGAWGRGGG